METLAEFKRFRLGLTIKLWAMVILMVALVVPLLSPTMLGLLAAVLFPLVLDLIGRCLCVRPAPRPWVVRLSIVLQVVGILGFVLSLFVVPIYQLGELNTPTGLFIGTVWAIILQAASAQFFVVHLQENAQSWGRPDLAVRVAELRGSLVRTTFAAYGTGFVSVLVLSVALLLGLAAYGVGLIFTLPLAFIFIMPLWMACMVFYCLVLYRYYVVLQGFREALQCEK